MSTFDLTVFVGDVDVGLSVSAKTHDPLAFLIDHTNYKNFLTTDLTKDTTVYTSLGDLPNNLEILYNILILASKIVYAPPATWSDKNKIAPEDPFKSLQGKTENILLIMSRYRPVINIELCYFYPDTIPVIDSRKTSQSQLWIVGPSITHGSGVKANEKYGKLVADSLGMNCSFLTKPKSSITWAADQIIRSNAKSGDLIVWGIANTERLDTVKDNRLEFVTPSDYQSNPELAKEFPFSTLFNQTTFYSHLYAIEKVLNYCNNLDIKLFILGLIVSPNMLRYLKTKKNFFDFPYQINHTEPFEYPKFLDIGTDHIHPGPQQHQAYKNFILENLNKI